MAIFTISREFNLRNCKNIKHKGQVYYCFFK